MLPDRDVRQAMRLLRDGVPIRVVAMKLGRDPRDLLRMVREIVAEVSIRAA